MKWFFALNSVSMNAQRLFWEHMMLAAVGSARTHTDLDPHLIWDGGDDPFLDRLRELGVTVVSHQITFHDAIEAYTDSGLYRMIAAGAFLRTELPLLADDELVLYTDCDVLFTGPFVVPFTPKAFACAPEFDRGNPAEINTGVMLMNLPALRASIGEFQQFIRANLDAFATFDQDAYRQYYGDVAELLPDTYNWKPYWGINDDAVVVHFHGPKPSWVRHELVNEQEATPSLSELFGRNLPAYVHYADRWADAARSLGAGLS